MIGQIGDDQWSAGDKDTMHDTGKKKQGSGTRRHALFNVMLSFFGRPFGLSWTFIHDTKAVFPCILAKSDQTSCTDTYDKDAQRRIQQTFVSGKEMFYQNTDDDTNAHIAGHTL